MFASVTIKVHTLYTINSTSSEINSKYLLLIKTQQLHKLQHSEIIYTTKPSQQLTWV